MWKRVLLTLIAIILVAVAIVFWATSGMSENANIFFNTLLSKDYKGAYYGYVSKNFQNRVPYNEFVKFIKANRLDQVNNTSWNSRKTDGNMGELEGFVKTIDKSSIPLKIEFIKENDTWRIYGIYKKSPVIKEDKEDIDNQTTPTTTLKESELINLIRKSVNIFTKSLSMHNMSDFYNHISNTWQKQITIDELNKVFKNTMKFDLRVLNTLKPIIEETKIKQNGILYTKFYYNTKPDKIELELEYIKESNN